MAPALSYERVGANSPFLDVASTPSNVGAIPERFGARPGTLWSVNPTHSVCGIGPLAEELLGSHHLDDTPCGAHSPFRKLRDVGGKILMLGCGLRPNTSMHAVEELVGPPYLFGPPIEYRVILATGEEIEITCKRHSFRGFTQRYDRLAEVMPAEGLTVGRALDATVHVIDARTMWRRAEATLREDPLYFVDEH